MFIVKPGTSYHCQEELRAICIGTFVCHCQDIGPIESVLFRSKLVLKGSSPDRLPSSSISPWASTLIHKPLDNSMKDEPIVVPFLDQLQEIFTCFGTILKIKQKMNISHSSLKHNLVLFLYGFGLTHKRHFFFCLFLVDYISDDNYFRISFGGSSSEHVKSGSSV